MSASRTIGGSRLWPWRRWIIAFGVLLLVRALLPEILRRVIISQATHVVHGQVEIGDVDLALHRGGIALKDVAIRAAPGAAPLIAWKRVAVEIRWLPLLRKTVRLRQVAIESPRVDLQRLTDGQLNLSALLPADAQTVPAETPPTAAPTPGTASAGWGFGVDRIALQDGGLRFRDLTIKDSEPVEVNLEHIEVTDIALRPGVYGEPSNLHLVIALDEGSLDLDAHLTLRDDGMAADANLSAHGLPLRRARVYIPHVGWSALQGTLDATVTHRFDSGKQNALSGTVTLRDVAVQVPGLEEPALGWRDLTVKLEALDLLAQHAAVSEIALTGATLLVRPAGGDLLPFLAAAAQTAPAAAPPATPAAAGGAPPAESKPWTWSVATMRVDESHVRLLATAAPYDVGVGLSVADFTGDTEHLGHIELALTAGAGSVKVDGQVRVQPPGFAGTLRIADLSLPEVAAATGALPRDLLSAGRLGSELTIEAGLPASGANGATLATHDVRVSGRLSLADPHLTLPAPRSYSIVARSIDLELQDVEAAGLIPGAPEAAVGTTVRAGGHLALADVHSAAPGPQGFTLDASSIDFKIAHVSAEHLLAAPGEAAAALPDLHGGDAQLSLSAFTLTGADPKTFLISTRSLDLPIKDVDVPGAATGPIRVAVGGVRLAGPVVQVTRTADGLVLPQLSTAPSAQPPAPPAVQTEAPPPRPIEVTVDTLKATEGQVSVLDRTVKPFFNGRLSPLDVELRDVRWPALAASKVRVVATSDEGTLTLIGAFTPKNGWFEVYGEQLALPPFNPYATTFSSYSIAGGALSVSTKGSFQDGRYDANTWLTLHHFDVHSGAGESLFQQQFGIPIEMALALMRDIKGDIVLGIPIEADAQGSRVDVLSVVGGALRRALVNALASPLKLIGAVFGGEAAKQVVPAPIGFRPGRAELDAAGSQQIDQLAAFLASRPGIGVALETGVTNSDVRWLREQALRQAWETGGVLGALRGLTQRSTRDRVRSALEARAKDQAADLSAEDAAALDHWLDEQPPIPAERLKALAVDRLARTEAVLREGHGIDAARITRREPAADTTDGAPAVRIELGSVGN